MTSRDYSSKRGLLILGRRWLSDVAARRVDAALAATGFDERSTICAFRGIEGEAWPIEPPPELRLNDRDLADLPELPRLLELADQPSEEGPLDLVWLDDRPIHGLTVDERIFAESLGTDVGHWGGRYNKFSCILNEVIAGRIEPLREYRRRLNAAGLFASAAVAREYLETRRQLAAEGADLESFEEGESVEPIYITSIRRRSV